MFLVDTNDLAQFKQGTHGVDIGFKELKMKEVVISPHFLNALAIHHDYLPIFCPAVDIRQFLSYKCVHCSSLLLRFWALCLALPLLHLLPNIQSLVQRLDLFICLLP